MLKKRVSIPNRTITSRVFHSYESEQPMIIRGMLLMIAGNAMMMMKEGSMKPGNKNAIKATRRESAPAKRSGTDKRAPLSQRGKMQS
jgi:hypothetical protein